MYQYDCENTVAVDEGRGHEQEQRPWGQEPRSMADRCTYIHTHARVPARR